MTSTMLTLSIGQVAERAAVGVETVRFYERQGLIPEPPRTPSGYRKYPSETVERLRFIQRAKELGFSLRETQELISLQAHGDARANDVRERAAEKIRDISNRIRDLERMRSGLTVLMDDCTGEGAADICPILMALTRPLGAKR